MPDIPCAAPFAAATPGDIVLCVPGQTPPALGFGPLRLLVRYKGSFLADKQLRSSSSGSSSRCRKVFSATLFPHHHYWWRWKPFCRHGPMERPVKLQLSELVALPSFAQSCPSLHTAWDT